MIDKQKEIRRYFDGRSKHRYSRLHSHPVRRYEQQARQRAVLELLDPAHGELIADVGCGSGADLVCFAAKRARCIGIDYSAAMISEARRAVDQSGFDNVDLILASGTHLPFKAGVFDKVSCSEVIEHIPDFDAAIREMSRITRPHGRAVVTAPNWHSLYGLGERFYAVASRILRVGGIDAGKYRKRIEHPYDEWKTQKQVIGVMEQHGFEVPDRLGICYMPGQFAYYLPRSLMTTLIRLVSFFEGTLRRLLPDNGYMMALGALKKGEAAQYVTAETGSHTPDDQLC